MKEHNYSFSVVSHNQIELVRKLLSTIENLVENYEVILTNNTDQDITEFYGKRNLKIIQNTFAKGFGENHNYAFNYSSGKYFVIINPDIIITEWPSKENFHKGCLYTGLVFDPNGIKSDNIRGYPSIPNMIFRYMGYPRNFHSIWFAGMFLIFHYEDYLTLGGFDERFFMYLEDSDICLRAKRRNIKLIESNNIRLIHDSRRYSRKKIKYLYIHILSMLKFYLKYPEIIFRINP